MALAAAAAGCGPGQGEVSGRVTFRGVAVPGGWITFRPADGRFNAVTVEIDQDGNYPAVTLPAGDVGVIVDNRELAPAPDFNIGAPIGNLPLSSEAKKALGGEKARKPRPKAKGGKAGRAKASGRYVPIPERYLEAETSGLGFTVTRGAQKRDFELTD